MRTLNTNPTCPRITTADGPRPVRRLDRARRAAAELPPDAIEQIAQRVAQLLRHERQRIDEAPVRSPELIDAGALARHLGLTRTWVYENAAQLGAIPVGDGPRPRLRFDLETATQAFRARQHPAEPIPAAETPRPTPRRRRPSTPPPVQLLPIHKRRTLGAFARWRSERRRGV